MMAFHMKLSSPSIISNATYTKSWNLSLRFRTNQKNHLLKQDWPSLSTKNPKDSKTKRAGVLSLTAK